MTDAGNKGGIGTGGDCAVVKWSEQRKDLGEATDFFSVGKGSSE